MPPDGSTPGSGEHMVHMVRYNQIPAGVIEKALPPELAFALLDSKNFDNFMKRMKRKIDEDQAVALLRRIELDQDSTHRIKKFEFMDFIKPQEPFSKMLRRIQMKKEEDFGKLAQKKLVDKHTVNTKKLPDKVKSAHSENQTNKFNQN